MYVTDDKDDYAIMKQARPDAFVFFSDRTKVPKTTGTINGSSEFCQVRGLNLQPRRQGDKDEWQLETSLVACFCPDCCEGGFGVSNCQYKERRQPKMHRVVDKSDSRAYIQYQYLKKHFQWKVYVNMKTVQELLTGRGVVWLLSDSRSELLTRLYNDVTGENNESGDIEELLSEEDEIADSIEQDAEDQLAVLDNDDESQHDDEQQCDETRAEQENRGPRLQSDGEFVAEMLKKADHNDEELLRLSTISLPNRTKRGLDLLSASLVKANLQSRGIQKPTGSKRDQVAALTRMVVD